MKTFILKWRPLISSYKMEQFEEDMHYLEYGEFNWSVHEWEKARSGDNFYMVKVGEGSTGIVMKGFFTSAPYEAADWSGKRRQVHYMDFRPTFYIHPDKCRMMTTEELSELIPEFEWDRGHSGMELPQELASKLDTIWEEYIGSLDDKMWDTESASRNLIPEAGIDDALKIASEAHYDAKDLDGRPVILHPLSVGLSGSNEEEMVCGFLHDVLEDSDYSAGDLREHGFSEHIVDTLMLLCHDKSFPYLDYVRNIVESGNRTALAVKLNDLHHNLARGKAGGHLKQVKKHTEALELIRQLTGLDC